MSKAIELDPQDAISYNQRGIASFAAGNVPAALKDFMKAIELQPQLAEAYNNRGIVQRKLGDYRQAGKDFERATQLGMALASQHLLVLRDEARQTQERLHAAGLNPGAVDGVPGQQNRDSSTTVPESPRVTRDWAARRRHAAGARDAS